MVKIQEATAAIGGLIGLTTGWNDEAIEGYIVELCHLDDPRVLKDACRRISRSWVEARRPSLALIVQTYHQQLQSDSYKTIDASALGSGQQVGFDRGIEIAWDAYQGECDRLGKQPNRRLFEKWLPS